MEDLKGLIDEQLSYDLELLLDKYGVDYYQRIKTLLNVKIERRKNELQQYNNYIKSLSKDYSDYDMFRENPVIKK